MKTLSLWCLCQYYSLDLQATKKRNYKPVAIGKKNVIKQGQIDFTPL